MPRQQRLQFQFGAFLLLTGVVGLCPAALGSRQPGPARPVPAPPAHAAFIAVPRSGHRGVRFDDRRHALGLARVSVPAGRVGTLELVEPRTLARISVRACGGASKGCTGGLVGHDMS